MRPVLALLVSGLIVGLCTLQVEDQKKLDRLAPLIGKWKMTVRSFFPPEAAGVLHGTMTVEWTLDKRYVQLQSKIVPERGHQSRLEGTGFITYDENAAYDKRRYRAYFLWSYDGRCLPMQGKFSGKELVLTGSPLSLMDDVDFRLTATASFKDADHVDVTIEIMPPPKSKNNPEQLAVINFEKEK